MERDPAVCESMFERAVQLDPEFAEAHAILGIVQGFWLWRWSDAQQRIETAMRINPKDPHIHQVYSLHLVLLNRFEEAITMGRRSVELDPLMPFWNGMLACTYLCSRRYDEAVKQAEVTLDLVPTFWWGRVWGGLAHAALGHMPEAVAALERAAADSHGVPYTIGWLGFALARAGRPEAARAQLNVLLDRAKSGYVPALGAACIYAGLNDRDRALDALGRACIQRDMWFSTHIGPLFIFDDLRSDPRFIDIHRRVFGSASA